MKKMGLFIIAILVFVFGIGMTAKAASFKEEDRGFSKEQYRVMEEEYVHEIRMILLEKGCKNAGVTLTYITDVNDNREYTITLHHARLERMETQEKVLLESRLQESAKKILFTEVALKQL